MFNYNTEIDDPLNFNTETEDKINSPTISKKSPINNYFEKLKIAKRVEEFLNATDSGGITIDIPIGLNIVRSGPLFMHLKNKFSNPLYYGGAKLLFRPSLMSIKALDIGINKGLFYSHIGNSFYPIKLHLYTSRNPVLKLELYIPFQISSDAPVVQNGVSIIKKQAGFFITQSVGSLTDNTLLKLSLKISRLAKKILLMYAENDELLKFYSPGE